MSASTGPEEGKDYSYGEVAGFFKPKPTAVHFVLVRGQQIVALRLRHDYNPNITRNPAEIWVGAKGQVERWGGVLAADTKRVPVFVKPEGTTRYTYHGEYQVLDRKASAAELTIARGLMKKVHTQGVSRIVFLKRIRHATPS
jgi:hypothetical protein